MSIHEIVLTVTAEPSELEDGYLLRVAKSASVMVHQVHGEHVGILRYEARQAPDTVPDTPEALTDADSGPARRTASLIDTRDGASITRKDDSNPAPILALPLDLPEGVDSPEELGQIFDAPSRQELELYRAHMDDRDVVNPDHREEREAGFSEGWTRAYYLLTQTDRDAQP